ncbi:hypothetical protein [Polynucleobacter sp. UK-Kesae-W10]|uniref:hypothetical protein n=1 Tax=Polynucleobacter sp. UK-Kesae-W10 TaxID=1819738 RepID=UPI001C0B61A6|nr:hypothetical protein [Polynucleobacter sp. UK-Kesae-W10]MBU3577583.1 hypothetical protein [Polynucleobacter sp. UK-Kesae-W10]
MTGTTITLRATKGAPLTNTEVDNNFTSLANNKLEVGNNLSDLTSVSTAQANLQVDPAGTAASQAIAMAIALG